MKITVFWDVTPCSLIGGTSIFTFRAGGGGGETGRRLEEVAGGGGGGPVAGRGAVGRWRGRGGGHKPHKSGLTEFAIRT